MTTAEDKREQINYISVDSAPKRFAGPVSVWQAPKMLVVFTVLAAAQLWAVNTDLLAQVFPNRDYVFSRHGGYHAIAIGRPGSARRDSGSRHHARIHPDRPSLEHFGRHRDDGTGIHRGRSQLVAPSPDRTGMGSHGAWLSECRACW